MSLQPLRTVSVCLILVLLVFSEQGTSGASLGRNLALGNSQERPIKDKINGKYTALNCIFEDKNYKTNATIEPIWHKKPNAIIFNVSTNQSREQQEDNPNPSNSLKEYYTNSGLNFTAWNQFKENVRKAFVESVTTSRLNTVDPFLGFIQAYKNATNPSEKNFNDRKQDFLKFFNEYNVPYCPDESRAGILIKTFDKMDQAGRREAYLASAYIAPRHLNASDLNKGYPQLKKKQFQDHVAGVIKFNIGTREGYVLLDPGYFGDLLMTPFAIVLMLDEKPPHQEIIWGFGMERIKFSMGDSKDMWVIATYIDRLSKAVNYVVYYLGESYCSFLESTTKLRLIQPEKGMVNFDAQGRPKVYFRFDISPWIDRFVMGYCREQMIPNDTEKIICASKPHVYRFNDIILANNSQYKGLNETEKEVIDKYCKILGITTETLVDRIHIFHEKFMNDSVLLRIWHLKVVENVATNNRLETTTITNDTNVATTITNDTNVATTITNDTKNVATTITNNRNVVTTKTNDKNGTKQGMISKMNGILRKFQQKINNNITY